MASENEQTSDDGSVEKMCKTSVLAMKWDTKDDYLFFSLRLNVSTRKRRMRTERNLLNEDMVKHGETWGFATPVTVGAKIMLQNLWIGEMKELGWDDATPIDERNKWM